MDTGNPHASGFAIPNVTVTVKAAVAARDANRPQRGRVSAGDGRRRPASTSRGLRWARTTITWVAAHTATRLPRKEEAGRIHHGADDNASGTAAVLAIAETLAKQPRRRNVLLGFWSAEEIGLIGSNAFVNQAAGARQPTGGVSQLRHGRPHGRQQADGAGHRHERGVEPR